MLNSAKTKAVIPHKACWDIPLDLATTFAFLLLFFSLPSIFSDPGLGWHLLNGDWILHRGELPPASAFIDSGLLGTMTSSDQWLSDALFSAIKGSWGWMGLQFTLSATVLLIICPIYARFIGEFGLSRLGRAVIVVLVVTSLSVQLTLRPVVFSFVCFAWLYTTLYREPETDSASEKFDLATTFFVFVFWSNAHPGFVLGIGMLLASVFSFEGSARRRVLIRLLLALTASLLFPELGGAWSSPSSIGGSALYLNLNQEWLAAKLGNPHLWLFFSSLVVLTGLSLISRERFFNKFDLLLIGGLAVLSLSHQRFVPFFMLVVWPPVLRALSELRIFSTLGARADKNLSVRSIPLTIVSVCFLLLALCLGLFHQVESSYAAKFEFEKPAKVVEHLRRSQVKGRVFHSPDLGGYLAFKFWPRVVNTLDDRNQIFPQKAYRNYLKIVHGNSSWEQYLESQQVRWVIAEDSWPLLVLLKVSPRWSLVLQDGSYWLFLRAQ